MNMCSTTKQNKQTKIPTNSKLCNVLVTVKKKKKKFKGYETKMKKVKNNETWQYRDVNVSLYTHTEEDFTGYTHFLNHCFSEV